MGELSFVSDPQLCRLPGIRWFQFYGHVVRGPGPYGGSWSELNDSDVASGTLRVTLTNNNTDASIPVYADGSASSGSAITRRWTLLSRTPPAVDSTRTGSGRPPAIAERRSVSPAAATARMSRWTFNVSPGYYNVWTTWSPVVGSTVATNAPFTVFDEQTPLGTVNVNQQLAPQGVQVNGVTWQTLGGPYQITSLSDHSLVVQVTDAANGQVIADGIRIQRGDPGSSGRRPANRRLELAAGNRLRQHAEFRHDSARHAG